MNTKNNTQATKQAVSAQASDKMGNDTTNTTTPAQKPYSDAQNSLVFLAKSVLASSGHAWQMLYHECWFTKVVFDGFVCGDDGCSFDDIIFSLTEMINIAKDGQDNIKSFLSNTPASSTDIEYPLVHSVITETLETLAYAQENLQHAKGLFDGVVDDRVVIATQHHQLVSMINDILNSLADTANDELGIIINHLFDIPADFDDGVEWDYYSVHCDELNIYKKFKDKLQAMAYYYELKGANPTKSVYATSNKSLIDD